MTKGSGYLIFNASSGAASDLSPRDVLGELPAGTRLHEFQEGEDLGLLARGAVEDGAAWVAVAGGDGSVEAVAGGLAGTNVPLGVIPCGTYNNFAKSVGLPEGPLEAARVVAEGEVRRVDVGYVNGRAFFECVGAGLDAAIFPLGEEIKSGGVLKWIELFQTAAKYPRQAFEVTLDRPFREALARTDVPLRPSRSWRDWLRGTSRHVVRFRALMITVSNGPLYGANFAVAPNARVDDGKLTITVFKKYSKFELCRHFLSISFGRRVYAPRVVTLNAASVTVGGPTQLEAHRDGQPLDVWPLKIELKPKHLVIFTRRQGS